MNIIRLLHQSALLRRAARGLCRHWTIRQSFHTGHIYFDAIDHSWAWTGSIRYQSFDRDLQDCLLALGRDRTWLVDIGANVGVMTLSVLLRNPTIQALTIEPNPRANQLLRCSLARNRLSERCRLVQAACTPNDGPVRFDFSGSVLGHVTTQGSEITGLSPSSIFAMLPADASPLVKVDIEGFETAVLGELIDLCRARGAILVIELHPQDWNQSGNPQQCEKLLHDSGAAILDLALRPMAPILRTDQFVSVVAAWN